MASGAGGAGANASTGEASPTKTGPAPNIIIIDASRSLYGGGSNLGAQLKQVLGDMAAKNYLPQPQQP